MKLDVALGERYAAAVLELLAVARIDSAAVGAIGSHGQTVRHIPRAASDGGALTLQVGSAAILAERTGITVVSDFRSRDTAAVRSKRQVTASWQHSMDPVEQCAAHAP